MVPLGGILGVSAHLYPLDVGDFNGDLEESEETKEVDGRCYCRFNVVSRRGEPLVAS